VLYQRDDPTSMPPAAAPVFLIRDLATPTYLLYCKPADLTVKSTASFMEVRLRARPVGDDPTKSSSVVMLVVTACAK